MQNYKSNSLNTAESAIDCGNIRLKFSEPLVMGILNVTPDSFYDGGRYKGQNSILQRAGQMLLEGAHIIDLGGCSTRPGAAKVTLNEELRRILPAVSLIRKEYPQVILSVDTFRSEVACRVVEEIGPCIINDISGGTMDKRMYSAIGELKVPYVMMHIKGTPQTMQKNPQYDDLMGEIVQFFKKRVKLLKEKGVENVILDPGFGFGKDIGHNYKIMTSLNEFQQFNLPLLAGVSRKSMIFKLLGNNPQECLNGTTALNMVALMGGANILRVHDVKEAVEAVKIYNALKKQQQ